jgi:hypothetical protein
MARFSRSGERVVFAENSSIWMDGRKCLLRVEFNLLPPSYSLPKFQTYDQAARQAAPCFSSPHLCHELHTFLILSDDERLIHPPLGESSQTHHPHSLLLTLPFPWLPAASHSFSLSTRNATRLLASHNLPKHWRLAQTLLTSHNTRRLLLPADIHPTDNNLLLSELQIIIITLVQKHTHPRIACRKGTYSQLRDTSASWTRIRWR